MRDVKVPESMVREYAALMSNTTRELLESEGVNTVVEVPHRVGSASKHV